MDLKKIRNLRFVRRFNFHNCNKYETVAEHSFFSGLIAFDVAMACTQDFYKSCLCQYLAACHDLHEAIVGDVSFLIERQSNLKGLYDRALKELGFNTVTTTAEVMTIVHFADMYELKLYLEEERQSGNMTLLDIEKETLQRLWGCAINHEVKAYYIMQLENCGVKDLPQELSH